MTVRLQRAEVFEGFAQLGDGDCLCGQRAAYVRQQRAGDTALLGVLLVMQHMLHEWVEIFATDWRRTVVLAHHSAECRHNLRR